MSDPHGPLLVLGVGNVLLGDDGVGVHAIRALERLAERDPLALPPGTSLVDGGTLGLGLLPVLSDARAVLLIDAADLGRSPGSVEAIRGDVLLRRCASRLLQPCAGVTDLLATALLAGTLPSAVVLIGVQPGELAVGLDLSERVAAALPAVVRATLAELRWLESVTPSPRSGPIARGRDVTGAAA
jgi:hydrogenase maturation protease